MISSGKTAVFEAWIATSDGKRLPEHQVVHVPAVYPKSCSTQGTAECVEGTEFGIHIKMLSNHLVLDEWRVRCWVDGRELDPTLKGFMSWTTVFSEFYEKEGNEVYSRKLCFAQLPTVEERESAVYTATGRQNLGTIRITLDRGKIGAALKAAFPLTSLAPVSSLPETEVKAKCRSYVGAGTSRRLENPTFRARFNSVETDYYEFRISYMTRDALIFRKVIDEPLRGPASILTPSGAGSSTRLITANQGPATRSKTSVKRKRSDNTELDGDGETVDPKPANKGPKRQKTTEVIHIDDDSVDPAIVMRRMKYLEEENRKLQERLKRKKYEAEHEVVDLTLDDEDE